MSKIWQQLVSIWSRLDVPQRATIVLVALGCVALVGVLAFGASRPDYRMLVSDVPKSRVAEIVAYLEQNKIAYQVTDRESAILVPSKELYRLRNELAQQDMLGDGSKGFEILSKGGMFDSTFREHKTYDRAVAGELERSFKELPGVASVRVLIDRPQPSPFVDDDAAKPKASVKLHMGAGKRLTERQIAGILHLCAGAVAGLVPEKVEIMDDSGLLTPEKSDRGAAQAQNSLDAEMARETYLTRKAQEVLDAVVGPGRSRVKVSVKLDFSKRAESTTDPTTSKPLEEQTTTTDEKTPVVASGGVAGTASNVEGENRASAPPPAMGSKTSEQANTKYVVGKKTVTTEDEIGRTKGMNVSILLDWKPIKVEKKDKDGKPTGEFEVQRKEYDATERKRFEELVCNAIGFNAAKDIAVKQEGVANLDARFTASVQSMELFREEPDKVVTAAVGLPFASLPWADWMGYIVAGVVGLALVIVARGQLKRSHAAWATAEERVRQAEQEEQEKNKPVIEAGAAEEEDEVAKALTVRRKSLREQVKKRIVDDPSNAAAIVRQWLYES